jgi:hypothetical protein
MTRTLPAILGALLLAAALPASAAERPDGAHDFDFNFGTWHTHIKRLTKPLSGSTDFVTLDGTVTVHKLWDGMGQIEDFEADGPNGHIQGMTLFLYNPKSRQWSQSWVNSTDGILNPPMIGGFKNGRGELISQETLDDGRTVLIRAVWSDFKPDSHHFEEDYSDDGGKSWEAVFSADLTRVKS